MANPNLEKYRETVGSNPNAHTLSSDEFLERFKQKAAAYEGTKDWIEKEASLKEYIKVPQDELALVDFYGQMPEVEMSPDIKEFWQTQKDELNKIDMQGPQKDYLAAFQRVQDLIESMDERRRDDLSANNYDYRELKARESVEKAREGVRDAKKEIKYMENDVDPFKAMLGALTGTNKDSKTVRDTYRRLRDAKRNLRDAKINLASVQESRAEFEEKKSKLSAQEAEQLEKMLIAEKKMAINKETAEKINANAQKVQKSLHEQYALIDKYKAIQTFKKSNDYVASRAIIATKNPDLAKELEAFPETLPSKFLKVTLSGPLQLPSNENKITELDTKIQEIKDKLPNDINMENLSVELDDYTIKSTDTVESIEASMEGLEPERKKYKQLEMKKDHLIAQQQVQTLQQEIETLINDIKTTSDNTELQAKLQTLQAKQSKLKILEEDLQKDPYSQTVAKLQDLQRLVSEKEGLQTQDNIVTLESTSEKLENSNIALNRDGRSVTIIIAYKAILDSIARKREEHLERAARDNERISADTGRGRD